MDAYDSSLDMLTATAPEPPFSHEYAQVLVYVSDRCMALAEIRLYRFWLDLCAQHHRLSQDLANWSLNALHALPSNVEGINIATTLGRPLDQLFKRRVQLYTRFFLDGRHADDPLGLRAVALALACQLCIHPPLVMRRLLEQNTYHHFFHTLALAEHAGRTVSA